MADIITFVLHDILKISTSLISKYPTVQDKLIYLILIPHIILFIFIYFFAKATIARILGGHAALETALMFIVYLFLIYAGIYGTILIPIFISSFYLLLIVGLIFFVIGLFIHPARHEALGRLALEAGKMVAKKSREEEDKAAVIEKINREINETKLMITQLKAKAKGKSGPERREIENLITTLEMKVIELESEKRKLS